MNQSFRVRFCLRLFILASLFLSISCSRNESVHPSGSARKSVTDRKLVTWSYLRWMASSGDNPSIAKFLEDHNQLTSKTDSKSDNSGEFHTNGGNDGDDDPGNPSDCESGYIGCIDNPDDGGGASWRVDIPLTVNGQQMYLSVVVVYDSNTGQPMAQGAQIYGNNVPTTSNYASPVATYSNGQLTFIGNMSYSYTTGSSYQIGASGVGTGSIGVPGMGSVGIEAGLNGNYGQQYTLTNTGTMYVNFSVNLSSSYGNGMIQFNGINGPSFNYSFVPQ